MDDSHPLPSTELLPKTNLMGQLSALFLSPKGRLSRGKFWRLALSAWLLFWVAFSLLDGVSSYDLTRIPAALLLWSLFCLCSKRYHDLDKTGFRLFLLLIPVAGVLFVFWELGCRRGSVGENSFGIDPRELNIKERDYATVS